MAVALIADAHLGGPGGDAAPLVRQLEKLTVDTCERLVLLGDLFQVWVGNERYETEDIRLVVECLRRLRRAGLPIHYIEGNRDFFIAGSIYQDAFDSVGTELQFECCGERYLAVHGDGINASDYFYRFWRRLSKNPFSHWAMDHFPRRLAGRLINGFEQKLSKTNFKHKRRMPEEVIVDYASRRLGDSHQTLLLGHFHEPFRHGVGSGEVVVFDAWFRSKRVEWLGKGPEGDA